LLSFLVLVFIAVPVRATPTGWERRRFIPAKPLSKTIFVIENVHTYFACFAEAGFICWHSTATKFIALIILACPHFTPGFQPRPFSTPSLRRGR